jgi:hypothetical protein
MGYFGLLVGPPLIGFAAELMSLRNALGLLGILLVAIFLAAQVLSKSLTRAQIG